MNSFFKIPLVFAILGLALQSKPAFAETSSAAKTDSTKDPSAVGKEESSSPHVVATPTGPALFKLIDTNKDGRISLAEFVAYGGSAPATVAGKNSPGAHAYGDASSKAGTKPDGAATAHADKEPAATPKPAPPDAGIPTDTDTRAGRYTADVFEILDINHDKFLDQSELDALAGSHPISQP